MAILIRPVREQFEHDRVIRELEFKLRRRYDVEANVGDDQRVPVKSAGRAEFPDLILGTADSGRKPHAIVEVETAESVNRLEAMHEWVRFSKVRAQFHLYVPAVAIDAALRLCKEHRVSPSEVWTFVPYGDQYRFTQVLPTAGKLEPDMDLEEARAERRAAQAELAAEVAADEVAVQVPMPVAKTPAKRAPRTGARKVAPKVAAAVSARATAHKAAAAFSAAQAAKAANAEAARPAPKARSGQVIVKPASKSVSKSASKPSHRPAPKPPLPSKATARATPGKGALKTSAKVPAKAPTNVQGKTQRKATGPASARPARSQPAQVAATKGTSASAGTRPAAARASTRPTAQAKVAPVKQAAGKKVRPPLAGRAQKRR